MPSLFQSLYKVKKLMQNNEMSYEGQSRFSGLCPLSVL